MKPYSILFPILLLSLAGCEVVLDPPALNETNSLSITSLASVGEKLEVRVSLTDDINDATAAPYTDNYVMWRMLKFSVPHSTEDSAMFEKYYGHNILKSGEVSAKINGKDYKMTYNPATYNFECDYTVEAGDKIAISAKSSKMMHYPSGLGYLVHFDAHGEVVVPDIEPKIEIVDARKIYLAMETLEPLGAFETGLDSAMVFKLRIKAGSRKPECYRLKISSVSFSNDIYAKRCNGISSFRSNDPLLYDPAIEKSFGPWPAHLTDVFSSESFYGDEYVLEITSRLHFPGIDGNSSRYYDIELQPINRPLLEYLSVLYRLRVATDSYFSEPVGLPSNIDGGVGILGGMGRPAKIRYWLPGEEIPLSTE